MFRKINLLGLMSVLIVSMAFIPAAMAEFPDKTIKLIVGFGEGGGTDAMARSIASKMGAILDADIVVENRTGAGGGVAATHVMKAKPDGYTIGFVVTSTFSMETLTGKVDYTINDFDYLGTINSKSDILLARADHGYNDFAGLIKKAKSDGYLRYCGITTPDKTLMKLIAQEEDFELDLIPAKGGSAARAALKAGDAEVIVSGTRGLSFAEDNSEIMAIAALTPERIAVIPDLPTIKDEGYDLALHEKHIFFAPKNLPAEVNSTLQKALQSALADAEVKQLIERLGHEYAPKDGAQAAIIVKEATDTYKGMLDKLK